MNTTPLSTVWTTCTRRARIIQNDLGEDCEFYVIWKRSPNQSHIEFAVSCYDLILKTPAKIVKELEGSDPTEVVLVIEDLPRTKSKTTLAKQPKKLHSNADLPNSYSSDFAYPNSSLVQGAPNLRCSPVQVTVYFKSSDHPLPAEFKSGVAICMTNPSFSLSIELSSLAFHRGFEVVAEEEIGPNTLLLTVEPIPDATCG